MTFDNGPRPGQAWENGPRMRVLLSFIALERQTLMETAFAALAFSALVVSAGAWILLRREQRTGPERPEQQP